MNQRANDYIFNKKLFTNVFWQLQDTKTRYVISYGGASASKSWSQAQHEIIQLMTGEHDTLIVRKNGADIENSVYVQVKTIIERWGLYDEFHFAFSGSKREIKYKPTGRRFVFRGLDDPFKLKSIVNIRRIWLEEMDQFGFDDFKEINRRARGIEGIQITGTFNPILETHWIKEHFFDTPEIRDKTTFIHSTYKDNIQNLTEDDIDNLEQYKLYDINEYNIYALGQWGKPGVKRPFAFAFKDHHVAVLKFEKQLDVYLSFDFNVDPITCLAAQHQGDKIRIIKEFRLANSDIYELCREIRDTFRGPNIYFRVTGDATGSSRTAITRGNVNYYTIIRNELRLTNRNFNVPRGNPSVKNTRVLVNHLFMNNDMLIDVNCKHLIDDLRYVEVNEHGEVDKIKAEREGMNHLLDCLRYYCFTYHSKELKRVPQKLVR